MTNRKCDSLRTITSPATNKTENLEMECTTSSKTTPANGGLRDCQLGF